MSSWPPRFVFVGNSLALDFAQTGGDGYRARWEGWHTLQDLSEWAELCPDLSIRAVVSPDDLEAAKALREAIWAIARSKVEGRPFPHNDLALVEMVAAAPDLVPRWRGNERVWADNATFSQVMSRVARETMNLFGTSVVERFRECANPMCQLMFVDLSRSGKRRWCSMNRCGNLIKVARHRARAKGDPT